MKRKLLLCIVSFFCCNFIYAQTWNIVGSGTNGFCRVLAVYNNQLYAGGDVMNSSSLSDFSLRTHVARWNGTAWDSVGTGISSTVYSLKEFDGGLYAGGIFDTAGGNPAAGLAVYYGGNWSPVIPGAFLNSDVEAFKVHNNELLVGGLFYSSTCGSSDFGRWDGSSWLNCWPDFNGPVFEIEIYNNEIYSGGSFSYAGFVPANNIAKWNGTTWDSLSSGMDNSVNCLAVYNGELYAGGNFTTAGGTPASRIARWNGTAWNAVGTGTNALVATLATHNGELYVGGSFTTAGGNPANHIAKWNGISWSPVGIGLNYGVTSLIEFNTELYAGGFFGGNVVKLVDILTDVERSFANTISLFPNPVITEATINFGNSANRLNVELDVRLFNTLGEQLKHLSINSSSSGNGFSVSIDVSKLAPGIYFVTVTDEKSRVLGTVTRKMVKM